ncbi:MAG: hypothetical protein HY904_26430 [Deltaproteobacteria bacterium]|nr:hypothetical protein [Deltaproteobacteria bacterium]
MNRPAVLALWLVGAVAWAADRVVIVSEQPDQPEPGRVETASELYRLRLGGMLEGALGRDQFGNSVGLPRLRLRAEALVSAVLEVGIVAEAELSPWASPRLKEDGPGLVRDLYGRMALGNKKILDLGEARLGYFTVPVVAEQWMPQQEALFLTGSLGREAWLPGRELAASYEIDAYRWNVPVRGLFGLGSGVNWATGLPTTTEPHAGAAGGGAQGVPLTAGNTGAPVNNPALTGRVELEPLVRWTRSPSLRVGVGLLGRPLAMGDDARGALTADAQMRTRLFLARAVAVLADTERAPFFDSRALSVEGALQFIPDFADVRARYDIAYGPRGVEAHRLHVGMALFYLDGAPAGPLTGSPLPITPAFGRAFTILWVRSYDLMHYATGYGHERPADDGARFEYGVRQARWLLGGDTDQVAVRIAF